MGMTVEDAMRDLYEGEHAEQALLDSLRESIAEDLKSGGLRAKLSESMSDAQVVVGLVQEARSLAELSARGSIVLAFSAIEVAATRLLIRPLFAGAIHHEAAARMVLASIQRLPVRDWCKLVRELLLEVTKLDIDVERRPGANEAIADEVVALSRLRHGIVHGGQSATTDEAWRAYFIANHWVDYVYGHALQVLGVASVNEISEALRPQQDR